MLITCLADKGSPGVTTLATALAATWFRAAILAEVDPAGSDLPYRIQGAAGAPLSLASGLLTLASELRSTVAADLTSHLQYAGGGLPVLVGPAGSGQAAGVNGVWQQVATTFQNHPDHDVICDAGQIGSDNTPVAPIVAASDMVVVVTRNTAEAAAHMRHGLGTVLRITNASGIAASGRVGVVVVCDPAMNAGPDQAGREMREFLDATPGMKGTPIFGVIPSDLKAAAALRGLANAKLAKTPYIQATAQLVGTFRQYADALNDARATALDPYAFEAEETR